MTPERDRGWEPETRVQVLAELPVELGALRLTSSLAPGLLLTYEMERWQLDLSDDFTIIINHGIGVCCHKSVCKTQRTIVQDKGKLNVSSAQPWRKRKGRNL